MITKNPVSKAKSRCSTNCVQKRETIESEFYVAEGDAKGWWFSRLTPLFDDKTGRVFRLIGSSLVITARKRAEEALQIKNEQLEAALNQVKQLSGLLPICANCKKIRNDDENYWQDVAVYVRDHSEAEFTHGICPNCIKVLYPEFNEGDGQ